MYESFYGLNTDPFRLSADHRFCFHHPSYIRAKGSVQYALYRAEDVGVGPSQAADITAKPA
jgi:general secretion pathway protein A